MYTDTIIKLAQSLTATYDSIYSHRGNRGDSREKHLVEYLEKVMPRKFGFGDGEVFDKNDANSGQVDVIIYDNLFSTVFRDGSGKVLAPVESTYGVISVKSRLTKNELENAVAGIEKYDALHRPEAKEGEAWLLPDLCVAAGAGITFNKSGNQRINCIFAYEHDLSYETLVKTLSDSGKVDLLVVPGRYCVLGRKISFFSMQDERGDLTNRIIETPKSLALFILLLQVYLSGSRLISRKPHDIVRSLLESPEFMK